jgi:hypothetical protein
MSNCISSGNSVPKHITRDEDNKNFPILSFQYYKNIITKICSNNKLDKKLIIIYYLKTTIDEIIVKLLIKYLQNAFPLLTFITEYEYYDSTTYTELGLLYNAGMNDIVILSNSTFGYWMSFFNILKNYTDTDTKLKSVYFGRYLFYVMPSSNESEIYDVINNNGYLILDKDILSKSDLKEYKHKVDDEYYNKILESYNENFNELTKINFFDDSCIIPNNEIYYFYCYTYDMIRIFLVIFYIKKYENSDFSIIDDNCKHVIYYYYTLFDTKPPLKTPKPKQYTTTRVPIKELNEIFQVINNNTSNLDEILQKVSYDAKYSYTNNSSQIETTGGYYKKKYFKYKNKYLNLKK